MFSVGTHCSTIDRITNLQSSLFSPHPMPMNKAVIKMGLDDMGGCIARSRSKQTRKGGKNPQDLADLKSALADTRSDWDFSIHRKIVGWYSASSQVAPAIFNIYFSTARSSTTFPGFAFSCTPITSEWSYWRAIQYGAHKIVSVPASLWHSLPNPHPVNNYSVQ